MNTRFRQCLSKESPFRLSLLLALGFLGVLCATVLVAGVPQEVPDLTAHEWGTFTSIAGQDGNAVPWQTLSGSTDLPGFVEHLSDANFKIGLRGTIRMETPVLYFYSPREATVSVHVAFSRGMITEWYPHATRTEPTDVLRNADLRKLRSDGSITWNNVYISPELPGEFPRDDPPSRYYAARQTASTPLSVKTKMTVKTKTGDQQEKFLFYRGASAAPVPLSAFQQANGDLLVKSLVESEIPAVILFERRGDRIGYRFAGATADQLVLQTPDLTGNIESLLADLERVLMDQGLYPDEAHAMIETWRDSWFEEGSRLIYIVPRPFVDKILPLSIDPEPAQIVRVFVGRLEIMTPATIKAVKSATAAHDETTLNKYGRFLEPIIQAASEAPAASASEKQITTDPPGAHARRDRPVVTSRRPTPYSHTPSPAYTIIHRSPAKPLPVRFHPRPATLTVACFLLLLTACSRTASQNPQPPETPAPRPVAARPQPPPLRCPSGGAFQSSVPAGHHRVTLSWNASLSSPHPEDNAVGYCLYRSRKKHVAKKNARCSECEQVNSIPIVGTSCIDDLVADGATYYYVSTAINSQGSLSNSSNEVPVSIPSNKPSPAPASAAAPPLCRQPPSAK